MGTHKFFGIVPLCLVRRRPINEGTKLFERQRVVLLEHLFEELLDTVVHGREVHVLGLRTHKHEVEQLECETKQLLKGIFVLNVAEESQCGCVPLEIRGR